MAADVAKSLCKPLFILNVFVGVIFFAEMNLTEFEALDEYTLSNITTQVNDRCILVAVHPAKLKSGLGSILRKLSHAFKYETRVSIGVLKQTDVSLISWQNSKSRDLIERGDLAFFPQKMTDRTCLLKPEYPANFEGHKSLAPVVLRSMNKLDSVSTTGGPSSATTT